MSDRMLREREHRTIFSFVVDRNPAFVYCGWLLAHSLIRHCGGDASSVVVQFTPGAPEWHRAKFRDLGCHVLDIARFGDGTFCNKISQVDNLEALAFTNVVFMDTDMIAIADFRPFLAPDRVSGKIVDHANPSLAVLDEIAGRSGLTVLPATCPVDAEPAATYVANCNGGLYSVPKDLCPTLAKAWRHWALWLLENSEPLVRAGKTEHVDQIAFWLAVQHLALPFEAAPSNANCFTHLAGDPAYLDSAKPIAVLHYHTPTLDKDGQIRPHPSLGPLATEAVSVANRQIAQRSDARALWDLCQKP